MTRKNIRFRAPASFPTQVPCNIHAAITMGFAAPRTHPCSHYNAVCIPALQNTKEEPITFETVQTAAAHIRYPPSPPAATLHGKIQGFVLRLPPQHMQHSCSIPVWCSKIKSDGLALKYFKKHFSTGVYHEF